MQKKGAWIFTTTPPTYYKRIGMRYFIIKQRITLDKRISPLKPVRGGVSRRCPYADNLLK